MASYKEPDVNQNRMVVLNFAELFPADHPVPQLLSMIQGLDLSLFDSGYNNDTGRGGRPALPPDRMLALIIYSLLYGNISMRNLDRDIHQRADLMYLAGGLTVDHSTLGKFRLRHSAAILTLFTQTVFLGIESGLIDLETVCIDGTRIKANANRQDIGTHDEIEKRYTHIQKTCRKRYAEWQNSEDEDQKEILKRKMERLNRQKEKLAIGLEFLKEHTDKNRVHLTDRDADWQRDGHNKFIVGYNAHNAVDANSRMIIHQDVVTHQADCKSTVPMVTAVEEIKRSIQSEKTEETKYVLDSGYASEQNLYELKGHDLYMPDREFARQTAGGKVKPENRKGNVGKFAKSFDVKPGAEPVFTYRPETDGFICPAGEELKLIREKEFNGVPYRAYRKNGCSGCPIQHSCAGTGHTRKEVWIQSSAIHKPNLTRKVPSRRRPQNPKAPDGGALTREMRVKLNSMAGRATYSKRFQISEGVFGTLKAVRNGGKFLRRGLDRVRIEWTERAIAHNIARLTGFNRLNETHV